jgi:signal transduction histidine kinase
MEGFDKDWIQTNYTNRMANYSNLPAGNYVFMVKATNSNGAWMDNQVEIKVTIKPAIWNTLWFKITCFLLVAFAIVVFVTLRIRRIEKQSQELEKLVYMRTAEIVHQKEEILQQRDTIENQLRQLETALSKLQISEQELSELNEAKNKFFSIFAHDLRSPLNSLKGFSSLLANFADELSKEEIKSIALDLDKNINNSTKYLENLLTWARSQMNSIEFKPETLNLAACITISTELLQVNAQTKQIALLKEVDENLQIWADSNQFKTVLTNLIANAIKFTEPKGTVTIKAMPTLEIAADKQEPNYLTISIQDTGVGMPPSVLEKIFRIDTKHSTKGTQGESGTGLGLLLCKEFVEKNGGKIWVESQENIGTTFYFTIKQV